MNQQELDLLYTKPKDPMVEMFDNLTCPPIGAFFNISEIQYLYDIATSIDLMSKPKVKYKLIDSLMKPKGFVRLHAGTNRIVYRHLDITTFVAKIAIDDKGLGDNPAEYKNQHILKPYVTKTFEVTHNGVLAFSERVEPITNLSSFLLISPEVYDILVFKIIGKFVIDDVGTNYFMNWGVRNGIGPCLLDYPYVYELDSNKLYCNKPIYPNTKFPVCSGEIDYDEGFNDLVCTKCGKRYIAKNLAKDIKNKIVYFGGGLEMGNTAKIKIYKNGVLISPECNETKAIVRPAYNEAYDSCEENYTKARIIIKKGGEVIAGPGSSMKYKVKDKVGFSVKAESNNVQQQPVNESRHMVAPAQYSNANEVKEFKVGPEDRRFVLSQDCPKPNLEAIPEGLVTVEGAKPIPNINIKDTKEESVVYNLATSKAEEAKSENNNPLMQGLMAGISEDTVCGIVSGMSDEERKAKEEAADRARREQEAAEEVEAKKKELEEFKMNALEEQVRKYEKALKENADALAKREASYEENNKFFKKLIDSKNEEIDKLSKSLGLANNRINELEEIENGFKDYATTLENEIEGLRAVIIELKSSMTDNAFITDETFVSEPDIAVNEEEMEEEAEGETVDISVLKNFKPEMSESKEEVVYRASSEDKPVDKFKESVTEQREFFKTLDKRLDYLFDRKLNEGVEDDEVYNILVEEVKKLTEDKTFFNFDPEIYVKKFMENTYSKSVLTVDIINGNVDITNKY